MSDKAKTETKATEWFKVECPSGPVVEIRKMKGIDYDNFLDEDARRKGIAIDIFLESCTSLEKKEVAAALLGDRLFLLMEIRKLKSPFFYPSLKCPDCGRKSEMEVDLRNLTVRKLNRELLEEDYQFDITLPICGVKMRLRLLTGVLENRATRLIEQNRKAKSSAMMMARTARIEGVDRKTVEWFRDLDSEDIDYFNEEYERHDCGYDTKVEITCPRCQEVFAVEIPFGKDFFTATKRRFSTD